MIIQVAFLKSQICGDFATSSSLGEHITLIHDRWHFPNYMFIWKICLKTLQL